MPMRTRSDIVLIRIKFLDKDPTTGVALPQRSAEAAEYVVEATGPQVTDLHIGDKVEVVGDKASFNLIPRHSDLFVTREANVALVYED